ncbi:MAG: glycine betaine ABC transporter substrate-binding protein [Flavonifractor plautii]
MGRALHRHRQRPGGASSTPSPPDALLSKFDLVQLEDDASFFPPYYAVNFIRQECLDKYPELEEVLALLDGRISNEAMAAMNAEVDLEGRNAADVAHDFLVEEGLILTC